MHRTGRVKGCTLLGFAMAMLLQPVGAAAANPPHACAGGICKHAHGGVCIASRKTFGYYPPVWRRWPGEAPVTPPPPVRPIDVPPVEIPPPEVEAQIGAPPREAPAGAPPEAPVVPVPRAEGPDPAPSPPKDPGDAAPAPVAPPATRPLTAPPAEPPRRKDSPPLVPPAEPPAAEETEPSLDELFPDTLPPKQPPAGADDASADEDPPPSIDDLFPQRPATLPDPKHEPKQAPADTGPPLDDLFPPAEEPARREPAPDRPSARPAGPLTLEAPGNSREAIPQAAAPAGQKNPLVDAVLREPKRRASGDPLRRYMSQPFSPRPATDSAPDQAEQALATANPLRATEAISELKDDDVRAADSHEGPPASEAAAPHSEDEAPSPSDGDTETPSAEEPDDLQREEPTVAAGKPTTLERRPIEVDRTLKTPASLVNFDRAATAQDEGRRGNPLRSGGVIQPLSRHDLPNSLRPKTSQEPPRQADPGINQLRQPAEPNPQPQHERSNPLRSGF